MGYIVETDVEDGTRELLEEKAQRMKNCQVVFLD